MLRLSSRDERSPISDGIKMIPEETSAVTGSLGAPARPYFWNRDGAPNRVLPPPGKQGESGMGSAAGSGSGYLYPVAALAANRLTVGRYAFSSRFDRTGFVLGNKLGNSARGGTSNVRASAGASIGDFLRQASTKWSNAAIEIPSAPGSEGDRGDSGFVPVRIASSAVAAGAPAAASHINIHFPSGIVVSTGRDIEVEPLRRVLTALASR
jgi:hypothetical protein